MHSNYQCDDAPTQADQLFRFFWDSPGLRYCPGIPNIVFGMPKCPGLVSEVLDVTEHNISLNIFWTFLCWLYLDQFWFLLMIKLKYVALVGDMKNQWPVDSIFVLPWVITSLCLDTVSAHMGVGHLLLPVQLTGTHWAMIYMMWRLALTVSDVCLKLDCLLSTSTHSALETLYALYKFTTYLLTY